MRFDINRSSLCAHCSVAIRRRKFLVYFLLRLPAHFQPGQLQPKQHGDAWSDPANRRGYDFQNYSLDEKMLAITDELFPPLLSRALTTLIQETRSKVNIETLGIILGLTFLRRKKRYLRWSRRIWKEIARGGR